MGSSTVPGTWAPANCCPPPLLLHSPSTCVCECTRAHTHTHTHIRPSSKKRLTHDLWRYCHKVRMSFETDRLGLESWLCDLQQNSEPF